MARIGSPVRRLIAIVILAVLAAGVAWGAWRAAKYVQKRIAKARQGTCASHLKRLALAMLVYREDYDGLLPAPAERWAELILPYRYVEGRRKLYLCPADLEPHWCGSIPTSYAYNRLVAGKQPRTRRITTMLVGSEGAPVVEVPEGDQLPPEKLPPPVRAAIKRHGIVMRACTDSAVIPIYEFALGGGR